MEDKMKKLALVLPGGGACGRWQLGVLAYLYEVGILAKVDLICGTSVGGLNALLVGKYADRFESAIAMWADIKSNKDVFDGMLQVRPGFMAFFDALGLIGQTFKTNGGRCLLKPTGLYKVLDREFGEIVLKDLQKHVIITTTDMSTGKRLLFDSHDLPGLNASVVAKCTSAIPLAFPAVEYHTNGFYDVCVDGGLGRNNPVAVAIEQGADRILLIGTGPDVYPRKDIKNNVMDIAMRMSDVIMHTFEEEAWEEKDDYEQKRKIDPSLPEIKFLDIYPAESTGSALEFGNVEQFQKGRDFALLNLPADVLEEFTK
jgi:predicted acylesterase/phospholipase RssA